MVGLSLWGLYVLVWFLAIGALVVIAAASMTWVVGRVARRTSARTGR